MQGLLADPIPLFCVGGLRPPDSPIGSPPGRSGEPGGQQGAAPQPAAAGPGFAHQAQQAGGPSPAAASGGGGHSNGWGRPGGPNGMFNGSAGQRQSPSTHQAAAPMNPFAAAAAAGFSQVNNMKSF